MFRACLVLTVVLGACASAGEGTGGDPPDAEVASPPDACVELAETCNGLDDDCDVGSIDGSEDPLLGSVCDGGDGDSCAEGTRYCSGSLQCNDGTGTTTEGCAGDAVDEDCDGSVDEGWVRQDAISCPAFSLGSISGDSGNQVATDSWYNNEIDKVRITENNDGIVYLSGHFDLYSPPGVDYDLYLYCQSCGGTVIQQSTVHNLTGHHDVVDIRNDDDWGSTDDFDATVEIRYNNSNRCAYWTLTVTGNLAASSNNCDP